MKTPWHDFAAKKPTKSGHYLVYIDNGPANYRDAIQSCFWFGERWQGINQNYCPVTYWMKRPPPPKGTYLSKLLRKQKPAVVKKRRKTCTCGEGPGTSPEYHGPLCPRFKKP